MLDYRIMTDRKVRMNTQQNSAEENGGCPTFPREGSQDLKQGRSGITVDGET